jgi:hypothetical protein
MSMSQGDATPSQQVPVLTDVVEWHPSPGTDPVSEATLPPPAPPASPQAPQPATPPVTADGPDGAAGAPVAPSHDELVARVLSQIQRQADLMLDYRLRESLTPVLSRLADALVREARAELASTLRDVVARAVKEELARHRGG